MANVLILIICLLQTAINASGVDIDSLIIREDEEKYNLNTSVRRLMILSSFTSWMYLISMLSVYLA